MSDKVPAKLGRPRKPVPTEVMVPGEPNPVPFVQAVKYYASIGIDKKWMGSYFGTSDKTFSKWLDEDEDIQMAFDAGKEVERANLHNVLYRAAMAGSVVPALFLLKARHGYVEGQQHESSGGSKVNITVNMPASTNNLDDFLRNVTDVKPSGTE